MDDTAADPPAVDTQRPSAPPRHVAVVGVLSLLWNGFGAYDYLMTSTRNAAYLAQFPPEAVQILDEMPTWAMAAWAVAIWAAVLGSILLLLRSRFAVHAFAASLLGLAMSQLYQLGIDVPESMQTTATTVMTVAIWIVAIGLLIYAWRLRRARVLR